MCIAFNNNNNNKCNLTWRKERKTKTIIRTFFFWFIDKTNATN